MTHKLTESGFGADSRNSAAMPPAISPGLTQKLRSAWNSVARLKPPPHPDDPPLDLVAQANAIKNLRRATFRELLSLSPIAISGLLLINLTANFGGEFNVVIAIINHIDLSTAALALTAGIAIILVSTVIIVGPAIVGDSRYPARIRRSFFLVFIWLLLTGLFTMPFSIVIGYALCFGLLWLGVRHKEPTPIATITFEDWLKSPKHPRDTEMLKLWQHGRQLYEELQQFPDRNSTRFKLNRRKTRGAEDVRHEIAEVRGQVSDRQHQIDAACQPTWPEEVSRYAVLTGVVSVLITLIVSPPIGPRSQVTFDSGEKMTAYVLDGGESQLLLIDADSHAPRLIPTDSIKETRYCIYRSNFLQRPLLAVVNSNRWLDDSKADVFNCPIPVHR